MRLSWYCMASASAPRRRGPDGRDYTSSTAKLMDRLQKRRRRASKTAKIVTGMRALAHAGLTEVRGFSDPTALPMLPLGWRLLATIVRRRVSRPEVRAKVFAQSNG